MSTLETYRRAEHPGGPPFIGATNPRLRERTHTVLGEALAQLTTDGRPGYEDARALETLRRAITLMDRVARLTAAHEREAAIDARITLGAQTNCTEMAQATRRLAQRGYLPGDAIEWSEYIAQSTGQIKAAHPARLWTKLFEHCASLLEALRKYATAPQIEHAVRQQGAREEARLALATSHQPKYQTWRQNREDALRRTGETDEKTLTLLRRCASVGQPLAGIATRLPIFLSGFGIDAIALRPISTRGQAWAETLAATSWQQRDEPWWTPEPEHEAGAAQAVPHSATQPPEPTWGPTPAVPGAIPAPPAAPPPLTTAEPEAPQKQAGPSPEPAPPAVPETMPAPDTRSAEEEMGATQATPEATRRTSELARSRIRRELQYLRTALRSTPYTLRARLRMEIPGEWNWHEVQRIANVDEGGERIPAARDDTLARAIETDTTPEPLETVISGLLQTWTSSEIIWQMNAFERLQSAREILEHLVDIERGYQSLRRAGEMATATMHHHRAQHQGAQGTGEAGVPKAMDTRTEETLRRLGVFNLLSHSAGQSARSSELIEEIRQAFNLIPFEIRARMKNMVPPPREGQTQAAYRPPQEANRYIPTLRNRDESRWLHWFGGFARHQAERLAKDWAPQMAAQRTEGWTRGNAPTRR